MTVWPYNCNSESTLQIGVIQLYILNRTADKTKAKQNNSCIYFMYVFRNMFMTRCRYVLTWQHFPHNSLVTGGFPSQGLSRMFSLVLPLTRCRPNCPVAVDLRRHCVSCVDRTISMNLWRNVIHLIVLCYEQSGNFYNFLEKIVLLVV